MQTCCTDYCIPLLVQQHIDGADVFNRSWEEFKVGFNDTAGNFWVGNELLHQVSKNGRYKLRFDLRRRYDSSYWYWAEYGTFVVANEANKYQIIVGPYSAAGWADVLIHHDGTKFTTYDSDNDSHATQNCAVAMGGGFWWNRCGYCGVNTPLGSSMNFTYKYGSTYPLSVSRMWLTC